MLDIALNSKLKQDSYNLGSFDSSILLLMRNALFPWFVMVPDTDEIEFYKMDKVLQLKTLDQMNRVSMFIEDSYKVDKINIGIIGNVVTQLHVHVVGRNRDDHCWPDVVWGVTEFREYEPADVRRITEKLTNSFKNDFHPQILS